MFFSKKKPSTAMDAVIHAIYGPTPPAKSANILQAITIANEEILIEYVPLEDVRHTAMSLAAGPMPYSTHDLVLATALAFYKNPKFTDALEPTQMNARMQALEWIQKGLVAPGLLRVFEDQLYQLYKPPEPGSEVAAFEAFKRKNIGRSVQDAAMLVRDFMLWQHNHAVFDKPDDVTEAQEQHADRIEKAFLMGAAGMAAEGFSFSADQETLFLMNILGMYNGLDVDEIEQELPRLWAAADAEPKATDLGGAVMIEFLLNGKSDKHEPHLTALQRVCWRQ